MSSGDALSGDPVVIPSPAPVAQGTEKNEEKGSPLVKPSSDVERMNMKEYLKHVALWEDVVLSAKYFASLATIWWYTTGAAGYSVAVFLTMLVMMRTLTVFVLTYVGNTLQSKESTIAKKAGAAFAKSDEVFKRFTALPSDKTIKFWFKGISEFLEMKAIAALKGLEKAETDPKVLGVVFAHLVVLYIVLQIFTLKTLAFVILFTSLTFPPVYTRQKEKIDPVIATASEKMKPHLAMIKEKFTEFSNIAGEKLDAAKAVAAEQIDSTKKTLEEKVGSMTKTNDAKKEN